MGAVGSFRIVWRGEWSSPVAFATALLLGAAWVVAGVAGFGEVAWDVLLRARGATGEALMIAVVRFIRASHYVGDVSIDHDTQPSMPKLLRSTVLGTKKLQWFDWGQGWKHNTYCLLVDEGDGKHEECVRGLESLGEMDSTPTLKARKMSR